MKIFRTIGLYLAMSCCSFIGVCTRVFEPLLHFVAYGCEALASGIDKLNRELAHKFDEGVKFATGVSSGLQRESNGFRQTSASEEDWLATPAT